MAVPISPSQLFIPPVTSTVPIRGFIAATVPAKVDRVAGTTLFHLAVKEFGDALQWVPIAQMNGMIDPWLMGHFDILIPPTLPTGTPTGILGQ